MQDQGKPTNEREYIAFISYRHKPLDIETAKKLHRRIECYVIPKELRKEGNRKLGLVFRDQDELPISNNLTENICTALDHSEYLIVVCSPDTPESEWVKREISYFLEHHDRDHLLAILVNGEPDRSFPKQLTEIRDEESNLVELIEPLAANIVADSSHVRNRLFKTESLRIIAALIGCPYDALYQREHRYQMRRLGAAVTAVALVAAGFIGMLLNRNAKIQEQLRETMINESKAYAALSENAYQEGNYRAALEYALDALPGRDPKRPYVPEAEAALSWELPVYADENHMRYTQSFKQDTEILYTALSRDGNLFATSDKYGNVNVSDMKTGQLLWCAKTGNDSNRGLYFIGDLLLIDGGINRSFIYSLEGELVRQTEDATILYVDADTGNCLSYSEFTDDNVGRRVQITHIKTGEVLYDLGTFPEYYLPDSLGTISPDAKYCAMLLCQGEDLLDFDLCVFDLKAGTKKIVQKDLINISALTHYYLDFNRKGNLALALLGREDLLADREGFKGNYVTMFARDNDWSAQFTTYMDFGRAYPKRTQYSEFGLEYMGLMDCLDAGILMAARNRLTLVNIETGEIQWQKDITENVAASKIYQGEEMAGLILEDGLITMCDLSSGLLTQDLFMMFYDCGYSVYKGAISGTKLIGGHYVVIPRDDRTRAAVVSVLENDDLKQPPREANIPAQAHFHSSPSGNAIAGVNFDENEQTAHLYYYNFSAGNSPVVLDAEGMENYYILNAQARVVLTDTGKMFLNGSFIDFNNATVKYLSHSEKVVGLTDGRRYVSCADKSGANLITASIETDPDDRSFSLVLWEDADELIVSKIPGESLVECFCCAVSADGYVVCKLGDLFGNWQHMLYDVDKDAWITLESFEVDQTAYKKDLMPALAESHTWVVAQRYDGMLSVTDFSSGKEIAVLENTLPIESVTKLIFGENDEWVAAFTGTGALAFYSTKDGRELGHSDFRNTNLRFYDDARYEIHLIPEDKRILIIYDSYKYEEASGIVIDSDSKKTTGNYNFVTCYFPSSGNVLVDSQYSSPGICRLFTVEELQEKAEKLLSGE